jgi:hypothetical protein
MKSLFIMVKSASSPNQKTPELPNEVCNPPFPRRARRYGHRFLAFYVKPGWKMDGKS